MPLKMVRAHAQLPEPDPTDARWVTSFLRSIQSRSTRRASENTVNVYRLAVLLLARWGRAQQRPRLVDMTRVDLEDYVIWMRNDARKRDGEPFSEGYVSNQFRALKAFYTWLADAEDIASPMAKMRTPKVTVRSVPIITDEQFTRLIKPVEKARDFDSRRDHAIIWLFFTSGLRIEELTELTVDRLDFDRMRVTVVGKADKERRARFTREASAALDRYMHERDKHRFHLENPRLFLPTMHRRKPLLTNGIRHMIRRRATAVGLDIHPHMFRHTFCHNYLAHGGEVIDLMEQNGWSSAEMAARYAASMRAERAQANFDRVMDHWGR